MIVNTKTDSTVPTILIVDDLPANLKVLYTILEREGYNVRPVPSGTLALQVVEKEIPDLFLLDIMMPGMDGYEVCRRLKENDKLKDIPVIFISALNDTADIVKALHSGGVDYITKPFKAEEVIARVYTHIKLYKQRKEIERQSRELQKLNAERDKIYSIIAHDLRSAFSSILGLTEILNYDLPRLSMNDLREIVASMRTSSTSLYRLLENLLDWAKLKQGLVPFKLVEFELHPAVVESIAIIQERLVDKKIKLTINIPENMKVFTDNNILQSIIRNLLSNAVKFTPRGGKIHLSAKDTGNNNIEISVKDSGIGMSRAILDNLFRFDVQTNRQGTEGESSTGLGLIICKDFIEKLGGILWVESEEGKGSDFKFSLPITGNSLGVGSN